MTHGEQPRPALALLRLLGGVDPAADAWVGASPGRWAAMAALAARHRVGPLLYRRTLAHPPPAPPDPPTLAKLERSYLHTLGENERARIQLADLSAALGARAVPPVLLKGAHLAFGAYPDPAARPMSDLDLLVHPDAVSEAATAMVSLGLVPMAAFSLEAESAHSAHLPPFVAPGRLPVELHWRLLRPGQPYRVDTAALIRRARPFPAIAETARVLDPADAFLHVALHAIVNDLLDCGLRALVDLALLIGSAAGDPAWGELPRRAREAGAARVHDLAVGLLRRMPPGWPAAAPLPWADAEPEPAVLDLAFDLALEAPADAAGVTPNLAGLFSSGPAAAARRIVERAFPSRSEMAVLTPAAGGSSPALLLYPRRWATLAARHGPVLWRLLRGGQAEVGRADRIERGRALAGWCAGVTARSPAR
jgi:hypothetical protein